MVQRVNVLVVISSLVVALGACARGGAMGSDGDAGSHFTLPDASTSIDAQSLTDAQAMPGPQPDGGRVPSERDSSTPSERDSGTGEETCTRAEQCSDGIACNGVERCDANHCVAGIEVACDDGVACTIDSCVEPGSCRFSADDSACSGGQHCGATGCTGGTPSCSESPCRLLSPQCGCGAGDACYVDDGARTCARAGTGREGASCDGVGDCATGLDCINLSMFADVSGYSQCARYCDGDEDCVGDGSVCLESLDTTTGPVRLCTRSCDPIEQTGCASGLACNIFGDETVTLTDCSGPTGFGSTGDSCSDNSDCLPSAACFGGQCFHWCDTWTFDGCFGFEECVTLDPPAIIGGIEYGVCL